MYQLLNRTAEMRQGGSYASLKANAWFEKFDWVRSTSLFALHPQLLS